MTDQQHSHPIKQHYVPRFYLHRFRSNVDNQNIDKSHIYGLDKRIEKVYKKNIKEFAYLPHMYDVRYADGNTGSVEQDLRVWEGESRESIDLLVQLGWAALSEEHHQRLARFAALQVLRTDEIRKRLIELGIVYDDVTSDNSDDGGSIGQALELLLRDLREEQEILLRKVWVLGKSGSSTPLWASDVPVTRFNTPNANGESKVALCAPGLELYLPLSPSIGLKLIDPRVGTANPTSEYLSAADVDFRNRLQVLWSRQYVFSSQHDFQRAEEMLHNEPSLKDPDRPTPGLEEFARKALEL